MDILSYEITLDIKNDHKYTGHEIITLDGNEEKLILNESGLVIDEIKVNNKEKNYKFYSENDELVVDGIITSRSVVEIRFHGKILESLDGFYVARYGDNEMYTTQFEASSARRMFPCIDNPSYKATFKIRVIIDKDLSAISNMPVKSETIENGRKIVEFHETPRMSTYLIYLGIGRFEEKHDKYKNIDIILAAPEGRLTGSDYPMEIAKRSIEFYENYFGIDYVLPKMHLISVPEFAAGAMENWGAITFREIYLNVDSHTGNSVKKAIADVIAHEIAHQWFGDLVTMKWWNDLWLNESFATFMSYKAIDSMYPEFDMFGDFVISETSGALSGDSLINSHPIEVEVKNSDEISQIFDEISYGKGGSILRMINKYIGDENFKNGLNRYLTNFKYKNAEGTDLWEYLAKTSNEPVREIMESFIKRSGYPMIRASVNGKKLSLKQERFLLNGSDNRIWKVPLTIKYKNGIKSMLLSKDYDEIDLNGDFIKINADESGFYRVLYDEAFYNDLDLKYLSNLDAWGIVNDAYAFLLADRIDMNLYKMIIEKFSELKNYLVINEISNELFRLKTIIPENRWLLEYGKKYHRMILDYLGDKKPGEDFNVSIIRGIVSSRLALFDEEYAMELAEKIDDFDNIDGDMNASVLNGYAVALNDASRLREMLKKTDSDETKVKIINAMALTHGDRNFKIIEDAMATGDIKKQDTMRYYINAAMNPMSREYIYGKLDYIVKELSRIFEGSGYTSMVIESIIPYIGLSIDIKEKLKSIETKEINRGIKKGLEYLEVYSRLYNKYKI
ncbi:M1 family metallopeptidase [Picrophilus oshimae]|uniref:Aminopeptidase n=1 Tax=Picrophilus torridus (strain ATCC 700027 / DSM 9790 / JCM 10055 / NBRC 100828 / KAW 2/3) TaxID=1122961 RepID=A0A8G2FVK2_PICTO|nr:M1 family metallopeptidase [Picrophilus oshimae]SMD30244.1 tricorn protease interacting factor F2/3 [Picrophilus oshimae DSM 9789]